MNEEEKEAIEILRNYEPDDLVECAIYLQAFEKITNLIDKQQKEIEARLKEIDSLYKMMSIKDDKIDYLADKIEQMEEDNISKDKIRKLKEFVHKTLDDNGITRGYQLTIDNYFKKLLGE